jgi:hypothetical protein
MLNVVTRAVFADTKLMSEQTNNKRGSECIT